MEQIKIVMSGAVRLSAVREALYELPVHSGRIRTVTQGAMPFDVYVYFVLTYASWDEINMSLAVRETAS